jgi:hypothetical protein
MFNQQIIIIIIAFTKFDSFDIISIVDNIITVTFIIAS